MQHHIFLSPGIFGFARFAAYDYFVHVERALAERFADAGHEACIHVVDVMPTASIRRRATKLAVTVEAAAIHSSDAVHLLGHSTGGLDARLVASPEVDLPVSRAALAWRPQLRSITMMNTPHFGTPLASFFATSQGQRVLQALSAFTLVGLSLGREPLKLAGTMLGLLRSGERALGTDLLGGQADTVLGLVDEASSPVVRAYLDAIMDDQGAVLQLSPEAMELMESSVDDRPGVVYQSTASLAPATTMGSWLRRLTRPWQATSLVVFGALHAITARHGRRYPCAAVALDGTPDAGAATEALLRSVFSRSPSFADNDGIVPLRSQLRGQLIWTGLGDHLDVLGHFRPVAKDNIGELAHRDWLTSGSEFHRPAFDALIDAIATGMLAAS